MQIFNNRFLQVFKIFLLLLLYANACSQSDIKERYCINIDISKKSKVPLSEIADNVVAIPLETADYCLLKRIDNIEIFEGLYYVHDMRSVFVFDQEGKFVRQIGKQGRGPGEYNQLFDFCINRTERQIYLISTSFIHVFDIDGNFIKQSRISAPGHVFFANNHLYHQHSYLHYENERGNIQMDYFFSIYDSAFNKVSTTLINSDEFGKDSFKSIGNAYFITKDLDDQRVYFFHAKINFDHFPRTDTLYVLNDNRREPYITIRTEGIQGGGAFLARPYVLVNVPDGQFVYHIETRQGKYAYQGFIDDFFDTGHTLIRPVPHENMFFFTKETEYSENIKMEPNPTLYLGYFKKQ